MINTEYGLKIIDSSIERYNEKERIFLQNFLENQEEIQKENSRLIELENQFVPQKRKFCDKILGWRDDFMHTEQFQKISNIGFLDNLTIFYGGWGHQQPYRQGFGQWSRLNLGINHNFSGRLTYVAGYKSFSDPKILNLEWDIEKFSPLYLKAVCEDIDSGEIYRTIASEIDNRVI